MARARGEELQHAVHAVCEQSRCEPAHRAPVEALAAAREERDRAHEEDEVDDELHHPLLVLVERLLRLQVVEAERGTRP